MRIARKLTLLAATAVAAMAFMAAPASATDAIQVVNEKTATACPALVLGPPVTGGCLVHATGAAELRIDFGIFGESHEANCNLETVMRVNSAGVGRIISQEHNTGPDANCATVVVECNLPWSASGEEDGPVGVVQSNATICIDATEGGVRCQGNLAFSIVEIAGEAYQTQFNNASVGLCELDVDLTIESTVTTNAQIHVNHL